MGDNQEEAANPAQDLITEDIIKNVLQADKGDGAELNSFEIVDFTKPGDNYSTYVTSIEVKYTLDGEDHDIVYVAKVNPCRKIVGMEIIYEKLSEKENTFYSCIAPELNAQLEAAGKEPLNFPQYIYGNMDEGQQQIYLEDLRARGFKAIDRSKGLDEAHANLVFKEIAKLHAASFLLQAKSPDECLGEKHGHILHGYMNLGEEQNAIMVPFIQGNNKRMCGMLKKIKGYDRAISWIESIDSDIVGNFNNNLKNDKFASICHGDLWSNNFLFRYDDDETPVELMIIDLEVCIHASVAFDINYLMFTSLNGDTRKAHGHDFIDTYYSAFKDIVEAGGLEMKFTENELKEELLDKACTGALYALQAIPIILLNTDDMPDISEMEGDVLELCDEVMTELQDKIEKSPVLKPRLLSLLDELMETGIIP